MTEIITPDRIAHELRSIVVEIEKGPEGLHNAEKALALAETAWQEAYDEGYLEATGTIAEREIAGRNNASGFLKQTLDECRADLARVKQKIRTLDSLQSNLQTQLKAVMVTYEQAGR